MSGMPLRGLQQAVEPLGVELQALEQAGGARHGQRQARHQRRHLGARLGGLLSSLYGTFVLNYTLKLFGKCKYLKTVKSVQ